MKTYDIKTSEFNDTPMYRPEDPTKQRLFADVMSRIPKKIRDQLNLTCIHIIHIMLAMGTYKDEKDRYYLDTMYFSETWLAKQCGRSRVHISNMIRRMEKLGLIKVVRRRLPNGRFKTNLYRLTGRLLQLFGLWKRFVRSIVSERKKRVEETIKQKVKRYRNYIRNYLKGKSVSEFLFDTTLAQEHERQRLLNGEITKQQYWKKIKEIGRVAFFIPDNPDDYKLFMKIANEEVEASKNASM